MSDLVKRLQNYIPGENDEWVSIRIAEAADEIERLRQAIEQIRQATLAGRVCDDVAWFDEITTLCDFCDGVLGSVGLPKGNAEHD